MIHVFLICLACCCSSLMPLKQSESILSEDHIQVVEKKIKENYYRTNSGYYRFGFSDLFSYDFAMNYINYVANNYNQSWLLPSSTDTGQYVIPVTYSNFGVYDYNGDSNTGGYQLVFRPSNFVLKKSSWIGNTIYYQFIISNSSPYDKQITLGWTFQKSLDMPTLFLIGVFSSASPALLNGNPWNTTNDITSRGMVEENSNSYEAFLYQSVNNKSATYNEGYDVGYSDGYGVGSYDGNQAGYSNGYSIGHSDGDSTGYQRGYSEGIAYAQEQSSTALTIFTGIIEVGLLPVNVFLKMFEYEVFGINIAGLVSGLITIAMIMILLRFIFGGKQNGK